jgi:cholesterol oxidase
MRSFNRREFIGLSGAGLLAAITASTIGAPGSKALAAAASQTNFTAIVIGSGFGGSVTALRLGQAGINTLVVERGQEWPTSPTQMVFGSQNDISNKMFWFLDIANWPAVPPAPMIPAPGVMEVSQQPNLNIACGAAVGGGSIVYTGATVMPPQQYFDALYPSGLSYAELTSTWYPMVKSMLNVSPMPSDIYNSPPFTHSRVWDSHMEAAGYTAGPIDSIFNWNIIREELAGTVRPSAIIGETDFGCSDGVKQSLTQNYLPQALATGNVQLRPLNEVQSIGQTSGGQYSVVVNQLNPDGSLIDTVEYTCDMLFVSAGTLNTNRLLVAARDTGALPDLPASVGTGFGDNGDQYSLYAYVGEAGPHQGAPCASTIFFDTNFELPMRAESWQLLGAQGLPVIMTLTMTADMENRGTFTYDSAAGTVGLSDWTTAKDQQAATSAEDLNQSVINASPGTVPYSLVWPFSLTAHPLGGCVMGTSADLYGRINGYRGLYAIDGSLIPGNIGGANPSFTIAAIAERAIAGIIAAGG